MKQGPGFSYKFIATSDVHVAAPLEIFEAQEPGRETRLGPGHNPEHLLERRLVARDRQRTLVAEPVLLFGFSQKLVEDGVVQVRRAHDEPPAGRAHTDRHVTGRNVGRRSHRRRTRLLAPPQKHLADSDNASDFAALSRRRRHFA